MTFNCNSALRNGGTAYSNNFDIEFNGEKSVIFLTMEPGIEEEEEVYIVGLHLISQLMTNQILDSLIMKPVMEELCIVSIHLISDLDALEQWSIKWQMPFNPSKCEFLRITKKRIQSLIVTTLQTPPSKKSPVLNT